MTLLDTKQLTKKPPTIQDVAMLAGVSTATVSRVLSRPDLVSTGKCQAVREAIRASGYRVNRTAQNLRTQRSNTVLALLPDIGNGFFSQVLQGIEKVLTPAGLALVVAETRQFQSSDEDLLNYLEDRRADGVIILDGQLSPQILKTLGHPSTEARIIFACEWVTDSDFPSVRSDNRDGAIQAIRYLHSLGHRHIAHVMGPAENVLTLERESGFKEACQQLGVQYHLIEGAFTLNAGVVATKKLMKLETQPTAVFCASDIIAMGLISMLGKEGLSVPDDVSVFGFDDIELSEHFIPPISTIHQDRIALGAGAANLLLRCLKQGPQPRLVQTMPVQLITRESCSPISESVSSYPPMNDISTLGRNVTT